MLSLYPCLGEAYYHNSVTDETSWERPEEMGPETDAKASEPSKPELTEAEKEVQAKEEAARKEAASRLRLEARKATREAQRVAAAKVKAAREKKAHKKNNSSISVLSNVFAQKSSAEEKAKAAQAQVKANPNSVKMKAKLVSLQHARHQSEAILQDEMMKLGEENRKASKSVHQRQPSQGLSRPARPKKQWTKYTDDDTGNDYYVHNGTGETVWEKPKDFW